MFLSTSFVQFWAAKVCLYLTRQKKLLGDLWWRIIESTVNVTPHPQGHDHPDRGSLTHSCHCLPSAASRPSLLPEGRTSSIWSLESRPSHAKSFILLSQQIKKFYAFSAFAFDPLNFVLHPVLHTLNSHSVVQAWTNLYQYITL